MINEQSRDEKSAEYSWKWNSLTLISKIKYHFHFDKTVLGVFQEYWCTKSSLEPLNWMNDHCPLSGLELFRVELVMFTWLIGCGNTTSYPCQILLRSFHTVIVTFTLALPPLQLRSCCLRILDVLRLTGFVWCSPLETFAPWVLQTQMHQAQPCRALGTFQIQIFPCPEGIREIRQLEGPCVMPPVWVLAEKMNFSPSFTYLHQQFITCSLQAAGP